MPAPPTGRTKHDARPGNLPVQLTSFVGRQAEMAAVRRLLAETRLLTLTGPGGAGKTRLALQVAADLADAYPDGVWLAELASLSDPALAPATVAAALGVREPVGRPLVATLADRLRGRAVLLVLDNCEHLVEAAAALVEALLRACPGLRVLATSREALRIAGEVAWPVPPLAAPAGAESEAVRLFAERARAVLPDFALTPATLATTAALCQRLDGMPLAIELAAARVKVLTVDQMVDRLDRAFGSGRFDLLTDGSRSALPRQRTLRAMVDWSYGLLTAREQALFGRLAVFAGGWTLEAAESVCAGSGGETAPAQRSTPDDVPAVAVLDLLARLVDKSLVVGETGQGGTVRHRLLETLRDYGRERLAESGHEPAVRARHAAYFLALVERVEPLLEEADLAGWLSRLDAEHDNLRAALRWLIAAGDAQRALRLGGALRLLWHLRGHHREGRARLAEVLAVPGAEASTAERAKALDALGFLARFQGHYREARAAIEEELAIRRALDDRKGEADALCNLGAVTLFQGDLAVARQLYADGLAIQRGLGNRQGIADALSHLGIAAARQGDPAAARPLHEESLAIWRQLGDGQGIGWALHKLGDVALQAGDLDEARARLIESLHVRQAMGLNWGTAESLEGLALLAAAEGQPARAVELAGAADAICELVGIAGDPGRRAALERGLSDARRALRPDRAAAAWQRGRATPPDRAVAEALTGAGAGQPPDVPVDPLTARERQVADLIASGLTNRQIAEALVISERTAERHVSNVMDKLDMSSRSQIAVWAADRST
jgi:predicted ATPase/DNA-binding CsgD family transcriptional regulator